MTIAHERCAMAGLLLAALLPAGGCSNALIFATSTVTAVEVNAIEGGQQNVTVGYKRQEGVTMPVREKKNGKTRHEAFSVLSAMSFDSGSLLLPNASGTKIRSVFATGRAAAQANAPAAVANTFVAFEGDLFSPESAFLAEQIDETLDGLAGAKQQSALQAAWSEYVSIGAPDPRRFAVYMIRAERDDGSLQDALAAVVVADARRADPDADARPTDEQKADPASALARLLYQPGLDAAGVDTLLDAAGPHLEGIDQLATATPGEMVESLVLLSAREGDVEKLREVLSRVIAVARS